MAKDNKIHETTVTFTAEVTIINKGKLDDILPPERTEERVRSLEKTIKEELGVDDIRIENFKIFVN